MDDPLLTPERYKNGTRRLAALDASDDAEPELHRKREPVMVRWMTRDNTNSGFVDYFGGGADGTDNRSLVRRTRIAKAAVHSEAAVCLLILPRTGEGRFLPAASDSSRPQPAVHIPRRSDVPASALPHSRFRRSSSSWQPLTACCHTQRRGRMTFALR